MLDRTGSDMPDLYSAQGWVQSPVAYHLHPSYSSAPNQGPRAPRAGPESPALAAGPAPSSQLVYDSSPDPAAAMQQD